MMPRALEIPMMNHLIATGLHRWLNDWVLRLGLDRQL